jgi:hypothetical protein
MFFGFAGAAWPVMGLDPAGGDVPLTGAAKKYSVASGFTPDEKNSSDKRGRSERHRQQQPATQSM